MSLIAINEAIWNKSRVIHMDNRISHFLTFYRAQIWGLIYMTVMSKSPFLLTLGCPAGTVNDMVSKES